MSLAFLMPSGWEWVVIGAMLLFLAVPIAIVLAVVFISRRRGGPDDRE
ncbi:MAG: hypothetical protein WD294_03770 [Phycisphaeraceae bacterium]